MFRSIDDVCLLSRATRPCRRLKRGPVIFCYPASGVPVSLLDWRACVLRVDNSCYTLCSACVCEREERAAGSIARVRGMCVYVCGCEFSLSPAREFDGRRRRFRNPAAFSLWRSRGRERSKARAGEKGDPQSCSQMPSICLSHFVSRS